MPFAEITFFGESLSHAMPGLRLPAGRSPRSLAQRDEGNEGKEIAMAHRMTPVGFRSALLAMAVVGSSLLAPVNAQEAAPPDGGSARPELRNATQRNEARPIDADLPLKQLTQLIDEIKRDYQVIPSIMSMSSGPALVVQGETMRVKDAMKAIDAALTDKSRWKPDFVQLAIPLTPVAKRGELSVREVVQLLSSARSIDVDAVVVWGGDDPNSPLALRVSGTKANVEKAGAHVKQIIADEKKWREMDERLEAESTVTIDFSGGTVEEFVNAVIGKFNFVPPIYQDESYRKLTMRPVKTRLLDLSSALNLLSRVPPTDSNGASVPLRASFGGRDPQPLAGRSNESLALQLARAVMVIDRAEPVKVDAATARRAAFSLGDESPKRELLDATLDVLSVAINLDGTSKTFRAKFHAPSNILIVQGTPDELAVAGQIVKARFPKAKVELPSEPKS